MIQTASTYRLRHLFTTCTPSQTCLGEHPSGPGTLLFFLAANSNDHILPSGDDVFFLWVPALCVSSQNHRVVGVGRDLWKSSSPNPLPKQGHLQQAAQDHVEAGLEYLQRRRLHYLPGQPVPVLRHPQREEVLPHVQTELPVLQFVPKIRRSHQAS